MNFQLIGILVTILLSAWFAGAETAFLSFNKLYLPTWLNKKKKGAGSVEYLVNHPERFLVTTLTGNNIINVLYASLIALYLTKYGVSEQAIVIIAPLILLIAGEAVPKTIARQTADRIILPVGSGLVGIRLALWPITRLLELGVLRLQQRLGLSKTDMGRMLSRAEITAAIQEAGQKGDIPIASRPLIRGLLRISEERVSDIMTPRTAVVGLALKTPIDEARRVMQESGFSNLPCYKDDLDDVAGVVTVKLLLSSVADLTSAMQPLPMIPESLPVIKLLVWFRHQNTNFAGVIDEYGGFAGIVTREDLVEEMVGPIQDEYDLKNTGMIQITKHVWWINAHTKLSQIAMLTGFEPKAEHASIGGLVTELAGDIPEVGTLFELHDGIIQVMRADQQGVRMVRLTLTKK